MIVCLANECVSVNKGNTEKGEMATPSLKTYILISLWLLAINGQQEQPPHIIYILADDLGWNDVGFHGLSEIPTPNIDALAYSGLILNNYYVEHLCTPSRAALMTGKYPIHTGMQHDVLLAAEPRGLPLTERLLPEYLRSLGYVTHLVGKWHLGFYKKEYTPLARGFDTHLGYWTGHQNYYDHTLEEGLYQGHDMRRGYAPAWDLVGKYSTDVYSDEAVRVINAHNASVPMFLLVSPAATHESNQYDPLQAPQDVLDGLSYIVDERRRRFAGMLVKLDDLVGNVFETLAAKKMLKNSIVVFSTDNGGAIGGFSQNVASNWPLRGAKGSLWEGGVRGAGVLWSPLISMPHRVSNQMMHISDWLPTLYYAAGGDVERLGLIDGKNIWEELSLNEVSKRDSILHNIDPISNTAALTMGRWKIVKGSAYFGTMDKWYAPPKLDDNYNFTNVLNSKVGQAASDLKRGITEADAFLLREQATVVCIHSDGERIIDYRGCDPKKSACLFDILEDPCEISNLADKHPSIVSYLENELSKYYLTAVPPTNVPVDPRADPRNWNNLWINFGDELKYPLQ